MSNQVRFAEDTNFDSPAKPFNGNSGHTSTKADLARNRAELCFNMHDKITIVDYTEFIDHFLPSFNENEITHDNIFENIARPKGEPDMYKELPKAINDTKICPGFKVVANPYQADKTDATKQAVDLGLYRTTNAPKREKGKSYPAVDWFGIDLPMECKADETEQDAFDETQPNGEPTADKRKDALGQAFSYVELIAKRQHRMFVFMLFFLGESVRIARFDRSGVFVTRKFNYKVDGSILVDFLYRYSRLSDAERGYDPTVTRILPNTPLHNTMRAHAKSEKPDDPRDYVRELFRKSLNPEWPWWKVEVHAHAPSGKTRKQRKRTVTRRFAVGMPHFQAPGVAGRGTRGYVALPVGDDDTIADDADFVYLKDAWRVDHPGIDQEGLTLHFLNDKHVEHVPTLLFHGDLPGQATISQDHWRAFHPDKERERLPLKRHQHYRLVVKEVGLPLEEFEDSFSELCEAIFCCLKAHAQAFKAGIIHRDISAGNMLLYKGEDGEWYGLLNDWELSKKIDDVPQEGRQPDRTGTWQYMSANALNDPTRRIVIQDELESFFHVLLYYAVRFAPHNLSDDHVGQFLHDYFDAYTPDALGYRCGRAKLEAMQYGCIMLRLYNRGQNKDDKLRFLWPSPPKPSSPPPEPEDRSSSPAPRSSPCPVERAVPSAGSASSSVERSPSPLFSAIYGSDLSSLPSEPEQPSEDVEERDHPLNAIITQLLSWFEAHYALDTTCSPSSRDKSQKTTQSNASSKAQKKSKKLQVAEEDEVKDVVPSVERHPELDAAKLATYERLRARLESHGAMLTLISRSLTTREWPANDKGRDKKPKEGYVPPKSAVPVSSSTVASSKRRSMDEQPEDKPGPSKRSRT